MEHENPLDSNMNESDVEMFVPQNSPEFPDPVENEIEVERVVAVDDDVESEAAKPAEASLEFEAEVEPAVVDLSEPVAEPQHSIKVKPAHYILILFVNGKTPNDQILQKKKILHSYVYARVYTLTESPSCPKNLQLRNYAAGITDGGCDKGCKMFSHRVAPACYI